MAQEDEFLQSDIDDEKTIEYIKNYLPQELKERFKDDELYYRKRHHQNIEDHILAFAAHHGFLCVSHLYFTCSIRSTSFSYRCTVARSIPRL